MKIRLAAAAIRDLRGARNFIADDDETAAATVVRKLEKAVDLIGERPAIGRPTVQQSVREWSVPGLPYLIPYRIRSEMIEVLRIWHTSRKRPDAW